MFERFTERARQIVVLAQEEARLLRHGYIGTEHVLLGILREEEGIGARVLESFGLTQDGTRDWIIKTVGTGEQTHSGQIPFTPRAKKIFELALREALSLGHNYIGTEHILLGIVREHEGVAMRYLHEQDLDSEKIRNEVIRMLSGPARREQKPEPKKDWIVTVGGEVKARYSRKPNYTVHDGGVIEIYGGPADPVLVRLADQTIIIEEQVIE